ncbi:MAG TPA: hypothetical protein VMH27_03225 [Puia sp.]|nr:hypothetical protein [Puia sp.]
MRTIKRLSHLRKEQRRLRERRAELERNIRSDWMLIRRTLEPAGLAREALHSASAWVGKQLLTGLTTRHRAEKSKV